MVKALIAKIGHRHYRLADAADAAALLGIAMRATEAREHPTMDAWRADEDVTPLAAGVEVSWWYEEPAPSPAPALPGIDPAEVPF